MGASGRDAGMTKSSGYASPFSSSISCPSTGKRSTKIRERPAWRRGPSEVGSRAADFPEHLKQALLEGGATAGLAAADEGAE